MDIDSLGHDRDCINDKLNYSEQKCNTIDRDIDRKLGRDRDRNTPKGLSTVTEDVDVNISRVHNDYGKSNTVCINRANDIKLTELNRMKSRKPDEETDRSYRNMIQGIVRKIDRSRAVGILDVDNNDNVNVKHTDRNKVSLEEPLTGDLGINDYDNNKNRNSRYKPNDREIGRQGRGNPKPIVKIRLLNVQSFNEGKYLSLAQKYLYEEVYKNRKEYNLLCLTETHERVEC